MSMPYVLVSLQTNIDNARGVSENQGTAPRQDYIEIARRLGGELPGRHLSEKSWYRLIKPLERKMRLDLSLAAYVGTTASNDGVILSASEKVAIPLAIWFAFKKQRPKHVVIGHKLSSGAKSNVFDRFKVQRYFDQMICLCRSQANFAVQHLAMPPDAVHFIYDKVDERFFRPERAAGRDYILAVGQEQRDYTTLLAAVRGTGLRLVVVASSPWSSSRTDLFRQENVTVLRNLSFVELRHLYAGARLVVVPLKPVDYAAGANGVLEAMSMARPVILTRTSGIQDYVRDSETGIYVEAYDAVQLREMILELWSNRARANRLGANARSVVESSMTMDHYVDAVSGIVRLCS